MIHIQMNIGAEVRGDGLPLTPDERWRGIAAIEAKALALFDGFTVLPTVGAWRESSAVRVVTESGLLLEILTDHPDSLDLRAAIRALAECARDALQQKCVLVRIGQVQAEFV